VDATSTFVDDLAAADGAFGQDPDGGHVGQGLAQREVRLGQRAGLVVEQVQRADGLPAQPQPSEGGRFCSSKVERRRLQLSSCSLQPRT